MTSSGRYAVRLLAAAFVFCVAGVQAQVQMQTKPGIQKPGIQTERPATSLGPASASASVEIVALSATPAAPKQGEMVTVKLSIRNSGQSAVAQVPWAIHWNANQTLAQGVQPNVVPGAVFEVTASWRAVPGEQLFQGYVDGSGKTFNNAAPVAKRIAHLPLTIAQVSASTQGAAPAMETQVLHFQKAKLAGAMIVNTLLPGAPAGCLTFGVHEAGSVSRSNANSGSVYFTVNCYGGAAATGEAFKNFRLQNGWKIKSVDLVGANTDWQYRRQPQNGSNDPHMIVEMTGNGYAVFRIDIEGPAGTSPYN